MKVELSGLFMDTNTQNEKKKIENVLDRAFELKKCMIELMFDNV